ncbi:hypothetical protein TI04_01295 [Achromatium sp. WMS2]|nr:hypothetical protein TI04_01295 [Achromatium sp. WMS2]
MGKRCILNVILHHGANQPLLDQESNWAIVYNGEIYNYIELKQDLIALGHTFKTNSDTEAEVLLKAWVEWKLGALHRLNGMFAFAVFNIKN